MKKAPKAKTAFRVGSNFFLTDRQLAVNYEKPFAALCATPPAHRNSSSSAENSFSVPGTGLEPASFLQHSHLKAASLPFHHPGKFVHFNRNYIIFKKGEKEG